MSNKSWMFPVLIILSVAVVLLLVRTGRGNTPQRSREPESAKPMELVTTVLSRQVKYNSMLTADELSLPVSDEEGRQIDLRTLLTDAPTFFFRFTELNCDECVQSQLKKIDRLINVVGKKKIIFLVSYESNHAIQLLKKNYGLRGTVYNIPVEKMQGWEIEKLNIPYCFMADQHGATSFFLPDKAMPFLSDIYYETVKATIANYSEKEETAHHDAHATILHFDKDTLSLKSWPASQIATFTFRFLNAGKFPLWITKISTGCECAQAEWPRYPVPPGDSAIITLQYHPIEIGLFSRQIDVFGNLQDGPIPLKISGNVVEQ